MKKVIHTGSRRVEVMVTSAGRFVFLTPVRDLGASTRTIPNTFTTAAMDSWKRRQSYKMLAANLNRIAE